MNTTLLTQFIILNILNVIIQTVKSLCTVKCGKTIAALANALAYGLYTIVVIYMVCDLPLMWKVGIVATCNLIGVWIVKFLEEKATKDRLWKVEATINNDFVSEVKYLLKDIPQSCININSKYTLFNFYCATQKESAKVRAVINEYHAKYFVVESKNL